VWPKAAIGGCEYCHMECIQKALNKNPTYVRAWSDLGALGGGAVGGRNYYEKKCFQKALENDAAAW